MFGLLGVGKMVHSYFEKFNADLKRETEVGERNRI